MLKYYLNNPKKVLKSGLFDPSLAKNVLLRDIFWQMTQWLPVLNNLTRIKMTPMRLPNLLRIKITPKP